jgi:hypothetical protein
MGDGASADVAAEDAAADDIAAVGAGATVIPEDGDAVPRGARIRASQA